MGPYSASSCLLLRADTVDVDEDRVVASSGNHDLMNSHLLQLNIAPYFENKSDYVK